MLLIENHVILKILFCDIFKKIYRISHHFLNLTVRSHIFPVFMRLIRNRNKVTVQCDISILKFKFIRSVSKLNVREKSGKVDQLFLHLRSILLYTLQALYIASHCLVMHLLLLFPTCVDSNLNQTIHSFLFKENSKVSF